MIDPAALSREIAAEAGADVDIAVDALRYFLLREIPFGADGDFNKAALIHRFNADLANDYGNLLNRALPIVERQLGGRIPARGPEQGGDAALRELTAAVASAIEPAIDRLDFRSALEEIWKILSAGNNTLTKRRRGGCSKRRQQRGSTILYNTLEAVRVATVLLSPWLPTAAARVWDQLGISAPLAAQRLPDAARWGGLPKGPRCAPERRSFRESRPGPPGGISRGARAVRRVSARPPRRQPPARRPGEART